MIGLVGEPAFVRLAASPDAQERAPGIPDLLIAAVAERAGLTLLHLDKDFELIAEITGQPVERLRTV
nr:PIN domain-containing protein [Nocardiopsis dassonvillei]